MKKPKETFIEIDWMMIVSDEEQEATLVKNRISRYFFCYWVFFLCSRTSYVGPFVHRERGRSHTLSRVVVTASSGGASILTHVHTDYVTL